MTDHEHESDLFAYPPAPWKMQGQWWMHLLAVPKNRLPPLPEGFRALNVARRSLMLAGWVRYESGPVGPYRELFAAVLGRIGPRPAQVVTHMWVDNAVSRAGGRELWGYPKEMAELTVAAEARNMTASAYLDGNEIAHGGYRPRATLPLRVHLPFATAQAHNGAVRVAGIRVSARPTLGGAATFQPAADGPLGFLAGSRRLLTLGLLDFDAAFGL